MTDAVDDNWDYEIVDKNNSKVYLVKFNHANELGLYDMSGNVWTWCQDELIDYTEIPIINIIDKNKFNCVCSGGSWTSTKSLCRVLTRNNVKSDTYDVDVGFRLVLVPLSL